MPLNQQRLETIKQRLTTALNPQHLVVTDDSHRHVGHPGAKDGRGHFTVEISAMAFQNKSSMQCHRMIYDALGDLMKTDIHALRIKIIN
ncbi:BolA family protein [Candidiatus Paracoxiella cheracis]|uniref:BolA family protein n=1 Tax=Candidiatus Paracoxiella cheracis TaxID=3405120 RepID=UPI003BF48ABD